MRGRQAGVSAFTVAIILIFVAVLFLAARALFSTTASLGRSSEAAASLAAGQAALEQFASGTGRLPCPANPALDTGDAVPDTASAICTFPAGTIPWKTIGMSRENAYDPWGSKISYRVYTAASGSLTQDQGASMVQCDSNVPAGRSPGTLPTGLCYAAFGRHTSEADFLAGKGLVVNDFATTVTGVAYVLISHGATGLGGWTPGGTQRSMPASATELANTTASGPFVAQAASDPSVSATDAAHFDDLLAYRTISGLARQANIASRDWTDPAITNESVTLNAATLTQSLGSAPAYGDVGRQTLGLANSTITAFDSGGNQDIAFNSVGGNEGIGGVSGGSDGLSQTGGEGVRVSLAKRAARFGVTLNDFGTVPAFFTFVWKEQAQFRFIDSTSGTFVNITKQGCNADGGLASFASLDPGAALGDPTFQFDTVEIRPQLSTAVPFFGSISSSFFISAFVTCDTGAACTSPLEAPANLCP